MCACVCASISFLFCAKVTLSKIEVASGLWWTSYMGRADEYWYDLYSSLAYRADSLLGEREGWMGGTLREGIEIWFRREAFGVCSLVVLMPSIPTGIYLSDPPSHRIFMPEETGHSYMRER